jgi:hypothetical protein
MYCLDSKIGSGVSSTVFRAVHRQTGRVYAAKLVPLPDTEWLGMWEAESGLCGVGIVICLPSPDGAGVGSLVAAI